MIREAPQKITYSKKEKTLCIAWKLEKYDLPAELLRVYSPSADQKITSLSLPKFVSGKSSVDITSIEKIGNYAIKLTFDDGHNNGIYSWDYLRKLGTEKDKYWGDYTASLKATGVSRLTKIAVSHWNPPTQTGE